MSETSTGIVRDHLADMTRERDAWRREARVWLALAVLWCVTAVAPYIESAWLAWRAEAPQVSVQVQCMDPVRITRGNPDVMQVEWNAGTTSMPCDPDTWRCITVPCSLEVNECGVMRWVTP